MAMRIPTDRDIDGLDEAQQVADFRAAIAELAQVWEAWRQDPRFAPRDDVPPPPWKRPPVRTSKKKPPSKGELIAALVATAGSGTSLDRLADSAKALMGRAWYPTSGLEQGVVEAVERLRWLWNRHTLWRRQTGPEPMSLLGSIADGLNSAPRNDRGAH